MAGKTNEQIQKISQYFKGLTVSEGNFYLLVSFPKNWKVLDEDALVKEFNTYVAVKPEGTYFMTEMENGTDCLFAAVDDVIEINKSLEEKQRLLQEKAQELTNLFINEPLEKLKTLVFTFKEPKKTTRSKTVKKVESVPPESVVEENVSHVEEVAPEPIKTDNKKVSDKKKGKKNTESDTMNFMKGLVDE